MIRIGIVGVGFMGMIHYLATQKVKGARVTAIHTRDRKKLNGDWRGIQGNFGPAGTKMNLSAVKRYDRYEALLDDPDIDMVDLCTPTNLHPSMALAALAAGKHVLVEKAIALELKDADAMVKAAKRAGKLLMVAQVLPFFPEFAFVAETIRNETYGKLLAAHFKRIVTRADWSADVVDFSKTGGPAIDLHVHDTHFIGLVAGIPEKVFSSGVVQKDGTIIHMTTNYLYGSGGPAVSSAGGVLAMKGRPFMHGFEIYLERATLLHESGALPLTVLTSDGKVKQPKLKISTDPISAFTAEIQSAVDGVIRKKEPVLLSGQLARDALELCLRESQSVKTGKVVAVH